MAKMLPVTKVVEYSLFTESNRKNLAEATKKIDYNRKQRNPVRRWASPKNAVYFTSVSNAEASRKIKKPRIRKLIILKTDFDSAPESALAVTK